VGGYFFFTALRSRTGSISVLVLLAILVLGIMHSDDFSGLQRDNGSKITMEH